MNPVMNAINSLDTNAYNSASNIYGQADRSFQRGASIALKLDSMLQQEEAMKHQQLMQSTQMLNQTLQNDMNNRFKQQQLGLQNEQLDLSKKKMILDNNYRTLANENATKTSLAKIKRQVAKDHLDALNNARTRAENEIPKTDEFGLNLATDVREKMISDTTKNIVNEWYSKQHVSNQTVNSNIGLGSIGNVKNSAPVDLSNYQPKTASTNNIIDQNYSARLTNAINSDKGNQVINSLVSDITKNHNNIKDPNMQNVIAEAIASPHVAGPNALSKRLSSFPQQVQKLIWNKARNIGLQRLKVKDDGTTYYDGTIGSNTFKNIMQDEIKHINNALNVNNVGKYLNDVNGRGHVENLFRTAMSPFLGDNPSDQASKLQKSLSNTNKYFIDTYKTPAISTLVKFTTSAMDNSLFNKMTSGFLSTGLLFNHMRNQGKEFDLKAINSKNQSVNLGQYMLPSDIINKIKEHQKIYKPGSPRVRKVTARAELMDNLRNLNQEEREVYRANIANISKVLDTYSRGKNGYISDGKYKIDMSGGSKVTVPLYNMDKNKIENVTMPIYSAILLGNYYMSGINQVK